MKTRKLTSLITVSSLLPIAAWANASSAGSATANNGGTTANSPTSSEPRAFDDNRTSTASTSDRDSSIHSQTGRSDQPSSSSTAQWRERSAMSSSAATAQVHRVSEDQLENRLTAGSLIGKEVVDRDGNTVGRIKDIGLASVLPSELRPVPETSDSMTDTASTRAMDDTASSTAASAVASATATTREPHVYLSVGGFMGVGDDLVAVPASQLERDTAEPDRFKINMLQDELKTIASTANDDDVNDRYSSASE
jgi:hypothetical protein